jgi:superfamily II DNA helicase RecQ
MEKHSPAALEALRTVFGYGQFRGPQAEIVEHVIAGGDALVLMPTGGGKSLCYQIPALLRPGCAIVVSPLIALMQDQVDALHQLGVRAAFLNSSQTRGDAAFDVERSLRVGWSRPALRRARTPADGTLPRSARHRVNRAVRDRRGALRVAMGP